MKNSKGQSLIEALVALSAAVAVVSAIAIAVIASVNNATFSKNQNLAAQYAQQGIEIARQQSGSNWAAFTAYAGDYCLPGGSTALPASDQSGLTCALNINNSFVRTISIRQANANCGGGTEVTVAVSWGDGKCTSISNPYCHNVTLQSCLANIDSKQLP